MTCHQAVPLLDDYLDGELSPQQVADLERHLAACPACRSELETVRSVRDLLKQSREEIALPDPGVDYWNQSENLILAKTIETSSQTESDQLRITRIAGQSSTGTLVRSMMLFAASLVLMISALYLGSQRQQFSTTIDRPNSPVLVAASASPSIGSDNGLILTLEEKNSLVRGMFALGAPGPIGRYTTIADLMGSY
jgi:hypothetical protein